MFADAALFDRCLVLLCHFDEFRPDSAALSNRSTTRETASSGHGHSIGQVRDLAWTRPSEAVSRLSHATRRSQGSLPPHISGLSSSERENVS